MMVSAVLFSSCTGTWDPHAMAVIQQYIKKGEQMLCGIYTVDLAL